MPAPILTLLTDFGIEDAYVAQMKGQILSILPTANLIDVSHSVAAQDIQAAGWLLAQSAPFFPADTLHIVVVDPGVGTDRRIIAVEIDTRTDDQSSAKRQRFVLPDNGLISPLVNTFGVVAATHVQDKRFWRSHPSSTFHGRDIIGPVAAHWANGTSRQEFGPDIDLLCLKMSAPSKNPLPDESGRTEGQAPSHLTISEQKEGPHQAAARPQRVEELVGRIDYIDHFGNLITDIEKSIAVAFLRSNTTNMKFRVSMGGHDLRCPFVRTYAEKPMGTDVLLVGSHQFLEMAVVGGSAALRHSIRRGDEVRISLADRILLASP